MLLPVPVPPHDWYHESAAATTSPAAAAAADDDDAAATMLVLLSRVPCPATTATTPYYTLPRILFTLDHRLSERSHIAANIRMWLPAHARM